MRHDIEAGKPTIIEINDPIVDPYRVMQVVRDAIADGRRVTGIKSLLSSESPDTRIVVVTTETRLTGPVDKTIQPSHARPYAIYESLTPGDRVG